MSCQGHRDERGATTPDGVARRALNEGDEPSSFACVDERENGAKAGAFRKQVNESGRKCWHAVT
jgi:hypothetical protein